MNAGKRYYGNHRPKTYFLRWTNVWILVALGAFLIPYNIKLTSQIIPPTEHEEDLPLMTTGASYVLKSSSPSPQPSPPRYQASATMNNTGGKYDQTLLLETLIEYLVDQTINYSDKDFDRDDHEEKLTNYIQALVFGQGHYQDQNNRNSTDMSTKRHATTSKNRHTGLWKQPTCPLDNLLFTGAIDNTNNDKYQCSFRGGEKRHTAIVCITEKLVFKKSLHASNYAREADAFEVLTDTTYFPKLYYLNDECQTLIIENVNYHPTSGSEHDTQLAPSPRRSKRWSENCTYYHKFYNQLFDIFDANKMIPDDLNVCCNTIVDGKYVKIIDFDYYEIYDDDASDYVKKQNSELLSELLDGVTKQCQAYEEETAKYEIKSRNSK